MGYDLFHNSVRGLRSSVRAGLGLVVLLSWVTGGCGYSFQNSKDSSLRSEGIEKIFVVPVVNNTYKAGVENLVYNSLIRGLKASGRVQIVGDPERADAILTGTVSTASFTQGGGAAVSSLPPNGFNSGLNIGASLPTSRFQISGSYNANLACNFTLTRRRPHKKKSMSVWGASFSRSKPFPGANQLDVPGTTSALINDSEFDRALSEIATAMMDDVNNSMVAMF